MAQLEKNHCEKLRNVRQGGRCIALAWPFPDPKKPRESRLQSPIDNSFVVRKKPKKFGKVERLFYFSSKIKLCRVL